MQNLVDSLAAAGLVLNTSKTPAELKRNDLLYLEYLVIPHRTKGLVHAVRLPW